MTTRHGQQISRENAEELLTGTASGPPRLAAIVAAATGPASSDELAGEAAALIRFQTACLEPAPVTRMAGLPPAANRLLAVKLGIVAALAAAGATGGVALAAATHTQTDPVPDAAPRSVAVGAGPSQESKPPARVTKPAQALPPSHAATTSIRPTPTPRGAPTSVPRSPWLRGLCIAYRAAAGNARDKRIENSVFAPLLKAAGGKKKVAAYCSALLREEPLYPTGGATHPVGPPVRWPVEVSPGHG